MKYQNKVWLPDLVGAGYKDFWNFRGRYRVVKGSRASKKSKTTALWFIYHLMKHPQANLLVVRKVFRTLKDSCFTELRWAIKRLQVEEFWKITESPLEITYIPTGQKIYFRGLDDPLKITSIAVENGYLTWLWIEEAYEVMTEADFDTLDESIRGEVPDGLFKQITLTFNPWNEKHWIKRRFFDAPPDSDIMVKTTNFMCNEWLDAADKKVFETMRKNNPRRFNVAGLGNWGIVEGVVYENWEEKSFVLMSNAQYQAMEVKPTNAVIKDNLKHAFGLDFGYTNDPSAFIGTAVDEMNKIIYVFDEMYKKALTNKMIFNEINALGYSKERITADSAEPKSITELREVGLANIRAARKGKDSVNNGIQYIQGYKIIVHPRCVNFLTEISNYTWDKDKFDKPINRPIDDFNHLMDAMRYALEDIIRGNVFSFE